MKIPNADPDAIMRLELEGDTLHQLGGIHAPALYDRPMLDDGRPCLVMGFPLPTLADRLGEVENGMPIDEIGAARSVPADGAGGGAQAGSRSPRPEAGERLLGGPAAGDAHLRLRPGQTAGGRSRSRTRRSARSWARRSTWRPSSSTRRRPSTSGRTSTRWARSSTRCSPGGRRSGGTPPRSSRRWRTGGAAAVSLRRHAPRALEDVIIRCLAKDPVRRFASTAELTAAFQAALADAQSVAVRCLGRPRRLRLRHRPMRRRRPRRPPSGRWPCWLFTASPSTR